jgi:hypothetical protein
MLIKRIQDKAALKSKSTGPNYASSHCRHSCKSEVGSVALNTYGTVPTD